MESKVTTEKPKTSRSSGIDIIKIFAAMMVVTVHFYLNTAFYGYIPITDSKYIPPIAVMWIAYTCVPLFMIATGYLMKNKTLSGKYYTGLIKPVVFYLAASTICLLFKMKHGSEYKAFDIIYGYLRYSHCDYAWYVEQYIVIFLFIPFLNLAFNGLKNKKQRTVLVVTAFIVFSFASSFYLGFDPEKQLKPLPEFPTKMYPVAYYFLGCYIREYPPKKRLLSKIIALIITAAAISFLTYSLYTQSQDNENQLFRSYHFFEYNSYPVFAASAGIFVLLYDIKFNNKILVKILSIVAQTSLLTYLMSRIFDLKYYEKFNNTYQYPDFPLRFRHIYEIVPKVYFMSLLCSLGILAVYTLIEKLIKLIFKQKENK